MVNPEPAQRIQFGEDIQPVISKTTHITSHDLAFESEKALRHDEEEWAVQITNADLNSKKKQVECPSRGD
jgi:hypothetical protein